MIQALHPFDTIIHRDKRIFLYIYVSLKQLNMRNFYKIMAMAVVAMAAAVFTGCSSDDDFLTPYEESAIQTRAISSTNAIIDLGQRNNLRYFIFKHII